MRKTEREELGFIHLFSSVFDFLVFSYISDMLEGDSNTGSNTRIRLCSPNTAQ